MRVSVSDEISNPSGADDIFFIAKNLDRQFSHGMRSAMTSHGDVKYLHRIGRIDHIV